MTDTEGKIDYDEFIVDSSKLSLVHKFKNKVEQLFSVDVYIDESTDQKGEKSWLRVDGQHADRRDARKYILAVCHPESIQELQIKDSDKALFNEEFLEEIERKTSACIKPLDKTLQICGSELSVILAMTSLESKGTVSVEDTEADCETDGIKKPSTKNQWASKMDSQLEKLLCNPSNNTESLSIMDFTKSSPSIKMTILKCMTDIDDDVSDSDLFPSCRDEAPVHKLHVYEESDEDKDDCVDGTKKVNLLTDKLTTAQISSSPDVDYLRSFGKSVGYTDSEVAEGLTFCKENTTPADFLNLLNELKEKKNQQGKQDFAKETSNDTSQKTNFLAPGDVRSPSSSSGDGRGSLPNGDKKRLMKDFTEETVDLSAEELKKRNEERQKALKSAFDDAAIRSPNSSSPQKKKRKKKKKNKSAEPVKFIGEGSKENPAIVCCSDDDDEEQTKVMTIWHGNLEQASDSDDCMIVDETFPQSVAQVEQRGTGSNQAMSGQKGTKPSGEKWTLVQNQQKTRPKQPVSNQPPPLTEFPPINQPPPTMQVPPLPYNQPPGAHCVPNVGDFQYREGVSNNSRATRFNTLNPVTAGSVTAPVLGVGAVSGSPQKNLRYIVIDGSNVAFCHGCNKTFSCRGIQIVIDYFLKRGHTQVTAFVPEWRRYTPRPGSGPIQDQYLLNQMQENGHLVFTPARRINNRIIASYDDRFVLELAEREDGIIVSNDQYRDLMLERNDWRKIIEERLLLFSFVGDNFMPPFDPLGRNGPNLDEFLCKPLTRKRGANPYTAPYNRERNTQVRAWRGGKRPQVQYMYNWKPQPSGHQQPFQETQGTHNHQQKTARGGAGGNHPQNPQKVEPARNKATTKLIQDQLKAVFPENMGKIDEILQNHPSETNVEKLSNYLLNAI